MPHSRSETRPPSGVRDAMAALIEYNARFVGDGRDPNLIRAKLERLSASAFGFFRGSFHLFVRDYRGSAYQPLLARAAQPIVGDVHLENFGAYRAEDGSTRFDINDFDETGSDSPALDLARMATSIVLARPEQTDAAAASAIGAFVAAWQEANESGEVGPLHTQDEAGPVGRLLAEAVDADRKEWVLKRVETVANQRRFKESEKYRRLVDPRRIAAIEAGVRAFARTCRTEDLPSDWPRILDVATRVAGTGSLGRFRWVVLIESKNKKLGKERVLELKEALSSPLNPERPGDPAEQVVAQQRLLQAVPPAFLGATHVGDVACTVRELQPTETKADVSRFKGQDLELFSAASGTALGRLHRRGSPSPQTLSGAQARALARSTIAFALRYAEVVLSDFESLQRRRDEVQQKLGLSDVLT